MAYGGTGLGLMVAGAGVWSAALTAFALRRAVRERADGSQHPRLARVIPPAYAAASLIGFGLGFVLAAGSTGRRVGHGFVGVAMSWLLVWFVVVIVLAARAAWTTAHYPKRVRPISPPSEVQ
jgi:hypothetical protein